MNLPLVSIGVPAYNNEDQINDALSSLVKQTYKNIEIIVSDDHSKDNTYEICKKLAKADRRIRVFKQKKNLGTANNFNFTLRKAKGSLFMWAAGDDVRPRKCVEELVKLFLDNQRCVLAVSAMRQFNSKQKKDIYPIFHRYENVVDAAKIFLHNPDYVALMVLGMYKTKTLKKLGGYHKDGRPMFEGASDFVTSFKILLQGELGYVNKLFLYKRDSGFFLSKYTMLKSGSFSRSFFKRIPRYLRFPIMFFFDFYYGIYYTLNSALSWNKKVLVSIFCLDGYLLANYRYVSTLFLGCFYLLLGLRNRIK